jgi:hypothetical protein
MFNRFWNLHAWQRIILAIGCVGLLAHMMISVARVGTKVGDYDINREFGRRFLAGDPLYQGGQCFNYMPISALYWAPLAAVPPKVGMALRYLTALVCLLITLRILSIMSFADDEQPGNSRRLNLAGNLTVTLVALILSVHYLIRDFDDGGPNVIVLAILMAGMYCVWRGRDVLGAFWLGLGIAVKITPGLFLPYLLWKRRWQPAAYTTVATVLWIALPAIWMGPASWWQHQRQWNEVALSVFHDSTEAGRNLNEQRVQNQALKPALMRYLVTYPPGNDLRVEHAGYVDFLNWPPETASRVATAMILALGSIFCWRSYEMRSAESEMRSPRVGIPHSPFRIPHSTRPENPRVILGETAALLLLVLLFSPVTWLQHFVFALPAIFWIVAEQQRAPSRVVGISIGLFALLALLMNRELLGRQNYLLLLSYHTHTLCLLLLFATILARLSSHTRAIKESSHLEISPSRSQAA